MKFSKEERKEAANYGLRLGAPYKSVNRILLQHGWVVDHAWLKENSAHPESGMLCGEGYNAACSTAYKKNYKHLYLDLSGTNDGIPLVGVSTKP